MQITIIIIYLQQQPICITKFRNVLNINNASMLTSTTPSVSMSTNSALPANDLLMCSYLMKSVESFILKFVGKRESTTNRMRKYDTFTRRKTKLNLAFSHSCTFASSYCLLFSLLHVYILCCCVFFDFLHCYIVIFSHFAFRLYMLVRVDSMTYSMSFVI